MLFHKVGQPSPFTVFGHVVDVSVRTIANQILFSTENAIFAQSIWIMIEYRVCEYECREGPATGAI